MTVRDDLLARVDIVDVVSRYVSIRRAGKNRMWLCPFHKEKSPSFTVAEDKQIYKCFGCGKWGNAVNFVMEIERIDFWDAIKELARQTNFDLTPYERNPEITEKRQQDREKLKLLNKRLQEFFVTQFPWSVAETYIRDKRKLTDATIQSFGIGYAPDSYVTMIEYAKTKGFTTEDLQQAWLASQWQNGAMPFFRHRVTFPIYDHIGNIVGFGGRALEADQNPKYLNTTETPLYEKSHLLFGLDKARNQIREHWFLVVVEWYMDVIAMHQYGLPLWVATCGTALTVEHVKLLKRHTDQVILLFDNDEAGQEATGRALKVAYNADLFPRAFWLPDTVKDVDERLTEQWSQVVPAQLLEWSVDAFQFLMHRVAAKTDLINPVFRKKFQQQMFGILHTIQDYGILMVYLEQMWVRLHMSGAEMTKEFKSRLQQQKTGPRQEQKAVTNQTPDVTELLVALRFEDFRKQIAEHPEIEALLLQIDSLITIVPEAVPLPALTKEEILPLQMRRERQLDGVTADKRHTVVKWVVQKWVHDLIRNALKNMHTTPDQKQRLLQMMR